MMHVKDIVKALKGPKPIDPKMVLDYVKSQDPEDEYDYNDIYSCAISKACKANNVKYEYTHNANPTLEALAESVTTPRCELTGVGPVRQRIGTFGAFAAALEKAIAEGVEFV